MDIMVRKSETGELVVDLLGIEGFEDYNVGTDYDIDNDYGERYISIFGIPIMGLSEAVHKIFGVISMDH